MIFEADLAGHKIELELRQENGAAIVAINGQEPQLDLVRLSRYSYSLLMDGASHFLSIRPSREGYMVTLRQQTYIIKLRTELDLTIDKMGLRNKAASRSGTVAAPIPGLIGAINVAEGDVIQVGDKLLILEAMKMENEIVAGQNGTVRTVLVETGQAVEKGTALLELAD
ncbi:MAG: acetyl-CoA carboxylase biotin carboxyl carrier protein subunit [Candidatus Marinimicrobia bacterium]|nr:acetyl-CoA carboxylase biotin carboxyl carrier protein subunit [Candidatus Neomarinimicrobiota bacterium]